MSEAPTGFDDIDEIIAGLTELAAWRTAHPHIDGRMLNPAIFIVYGSLDEVHNGFADVVRAITAGAPIGSVTKSLGGDGKTLMFVKRAFSGGITISHHTQRDEVCTRKVTGTRTVQVPDPAAPLVEVTEDIVEWDCEPILADRPAVES